MKAWGDYIEISGPADIEKMAKLVAAQLVESSSKLEGVEDRPLTIGWVIKQGAGYHCSYHDATKPLAVKF